MCLGIAGQIIEIPQEPHELARANVFGVERSINIGLIEGKDLKSGDWVLIHVGFAIAVMSESEARDSMELLQGMGDAFTAEMAAARNEKSNEDRSRPSAKKRDET